MSKIKREPLDSDTGIWHYLEKLDGQLIKSIRKENGRRIKIKIARAKFSKKLDPDERCSPITILITEINGKEVSRDHYTLNAKATDKRHKSKTEKQNLEEDLESRCIGHQFQVYSGKWLPEGKNYDVETLVENWDYIEGMIHKNMAGQTTRNILDVYHPN